MSSSRPIPARTSGVRDFASSFPASLAASFRAASPIAQEALARDLAACSDSGDSDIDVNAGRVDTDSGSGDEDDLPALYRKPSGIAFGATRPAVGRSVLEEPVLTRQEKKQSRDAERSLLRDNHIIPPKHPVVQPPGLLKRAYTWLFSTKVPLEERLPEVTTVGPSETSALLPQPNPQDDGHERLSRQWAAAVSTGQLKTTWQRESKTLAVYSRSLVVTFVLQYSINIASIFAVGHLGKVELGAVSCEFLPSPTCNVSKTNQTSPLKRQSCHGTRVC
jgi:multidrug resistance protein, MATE family